MARRPAEAEVEVAVELRRRGLVVSPRQVARWREERILRPDRDWPGGGGSTSRYSDEMVDVAETLARLLTEKRSLRDAVLILFGRGVVLQTDVVKTALLEFLEKVETALVRAVSTASTPTAIRRS